MVIRECLKSNKYNIENSHRKRINPFETPGIAGVYY
jgi:hypothetical protein